MAIKKCKACGKDVGFKANTCPHCGEVLRVHNDNPALSAIIGMIILVVVYYWIFK